MTNAKKMALCGMMAALAVAVMALGGMIPMATYCAPVLASAMLIPVIHSCGKRMAWAWYGAVAVLACLLCPDPEASILFLCIGYYPILRVDLERIRRRWLRVAAKLLVFHLAIAAMVGILCLILGIEQILEEYAADGLWLLILTWLMGIGVFLMTDVVLARLTMLFRRGRRK